MNVRERNDAHLHQPVKGRENIRATKKNKSSPNKEVSSQQHPKSEWTKQDEGKTLFPSSVISQATVHADLNCMRNDCGSMPSASALFSARSRIGANTTNHGPAQAEAVSVGRAIEGLDGLPLSPRPGEI